MPIKTPQICPYLFYDDVGAAIAFLTRAFGFREDMRVATPSRGVHAQVSLGDQVVMMGQGGLDKHNATAAELGRITSGVFVYLDDVAAHFERARAEGAVIASPLAEVSYGRSYTARDPEGQTWYFTTPTAG